LTSEVRLEKDRCYTHDLCLRELELISNVLSWWQIGHRIPTIENLGVAGVRKNRSLPPVLFSGLFHARLTC
jgi:hypothetical protein